MRSKVTFLNVKLPVKVSFTQLQKLGATLLPKLKRHGSGDGGPSTFAPVLCSTTSLLSLQPLSR